MPKAKDHQHASVLDEVSSKRAKVADSSNADNWVTPKESMHAHFDCFSGAAGDMMLAACLDAAKDDRDRLMDHVSKCISKGIPELADEFSISCKRVWRGSGSISATYVSVQSRYDHKPAPVPIPAAPEGENITAPTKSGGSHSHGHGHEHSHGHSQPNGHSDTAVDATAKTPKASGGGDEHEHADQHGHSHEHGHGHSSGHVSDKGPLRNLPEIRKMLQDAPTEWIPVWVRERAIETFTALAQAEASVHGAESMDAVHFHEVGAVDSIVDTVGTLLALHSLGVETFSCSRLPLGEGTVFTDHGVLPVPAPATLFLMTDMPVTPGPPGPTGELVTPTAAALLSVLTRNGGKERMVGRPPLFTLRNVGVGAGTKDFHKHPNILRLMLGDNVRPSKPEVSLLPAKQEASSID